MIWVVGTKSMVSMGTTVLELTVPSEIQGRVLSLWYVGAGFMLIGSLPMAMVAKALNGQIAIIGGAPMFLLISLRLGLLRPYLQRLKIQRARA